MSFHREKIVTTRKQHICEFCKTGIVIGEKAAYFYGKDQNNKFYSDYIHRFCWNLWRSNPSIYQNKNGTWEECLYSWLETHLSKEEAQICYNHYRRLPKK